MQNAFHAEWRTTLRQKSSYIFVCLWTFVITILFLLERGLPQFEGYTNIVGTMINLMLYLLPLFMLIIGSLAITNEVEGGQWSLLSTYPISIFKYICGKFAGQLLAQIAIFTLSFGISILLSVILQFAISLKWLMLIYMFAIFLIIFFIGIGILIGSLSSTRWQALMASVTVWFIFIMMWASLLIAILLFVPYKLIATIMTVSLFFNPAELLRVFFVTQFGGGAAFGKDYDGLISFIQTPFSLPLLLFYTIIYIWIIMLVASGCMKRRQMN
ncbi:ABC transporter permease [Gracilibacillus salinarum]|uniref:ABC transporter permease n=1 Tax=Gracilibacillus salinarum TaxID=2932255 RepID=A0ABY4GIA6_9BACI|nr:ABC transporter permease subunit [Gracilibacillus salinarum]UOQ84083.1 ABC transporter permease [Gracilibacillus salinarum]